MRSISLIVGLVATLIFCFMLYLPREAASPVEPNHDSANKAAKLKDPLGDKKVLSGALQAGVGEKREEVRLSISAQANGRKFSGTIKMFNDPLSRQPCDSTVAPIEGKLIGQCFDNSLSAIGALQIVVDDNLFDSNSVPMGTSFIQLTQFEFESRAATTTAWIWGDDSWFSIPSVDVEVGMYCSDAMHIHSDLLEREIFDVKAVGTEDPVECSESQGPYPGLNMDIFARDRPIATPITRDRLKAMGQLFIGAPGHSWERIDLVRMLASPGPMVVRLKPGGELVIASEYIRSMVSANQLKSLAIELHPSHSLSRNIVYWPTPAYSLSMDAVGLIQRAGGTIAGLSSGDYTGILMLYGDSDSPLASLTFRAKISPQEPFILDDQALDVESAKLGRKLLILAFPSASQAALCGGVELLQDVSIGPRIDAPAGDASSRVELEKLSETDYAIEASPALAVATSLVIRPFGLAMSLTTPGGWLMGQNYIELPGLSSYRVAFELDGKPFIPPACKFKIWPDLSIPSDIGLVEFESCVQHSGGRFNVWFGQGLTGILVVETPDGSVATSLNLQSLESGLIRLSRDREVLCRLQIGDGQGGWTVLEWTRLYCVDEYGTVVGPLHAQVVPSDQDFANRVDLAPRFDTARLRFPRNARTLIVPQDQGDGVRVPIRDEEGGLGPEPVLVIELREGKVQ